MHWTHNLDPILFDFGAVQVRWYGMMYLTAFVLGFLWFRHRYYKGLFALNPEQAQNMIVYIMIGMILGSRIVYVTVYNPTYYMANPWETFAIWKGGLSFHGAAIGFVGAVITFGRVHGYGFFHLMDIVCVGSALGIFFGRIGNFINGELFGRVSDVPWAVIFPHGGPQPRHPSQLYQALTEGLASFFILLLIELWERKKGNAPQPVDIKAFELKAEKKKKGKVKRPKISWKRCGLQSAAYLLLYGTFRFVIEFFREPDKQLGYFFGWMTMGQILCLLMILAGSILMWRVTSKDFSEEY